MLDLALDTRIFINNELKQISNGLYKPYFMLNLEKAKEFEVNKFHRKYSYD